MSIILGLSPLVGSVYIALPSLFIISSLEKHEQSY